jgi:hypothetical protein
MIISMSSIHRDKWLCKVTNVLLSAWVIKLE